MSESSLVLPRIHQMDVERSGVSRLRHQRTATTRLPAIIQAYERTETSNYGDLHNRERHNKASILTRAACSETAPGLDEKMEIKRTPHRKSATKAKEILGKNLDKNLQSRDASGITTEKQLKASERSDDAKQLQAAAKSELNPQSADQERLSSDHRIKKEQEYVAASQPFKRCHHLSPYMEQQIPMRQGSNTSKRDKRFTRPPMSAYSTSATSSNTPQKSASSATDMLANKGQNKRRQNQSAQRNENAGQHNGQEQQTGKFVRPVVSLKELSKYKETAIVYLDLKWKSIRMERFYSTLEDAQVKMWKQQRMSAMKHQLKMRESKERQIQQLRAIREKHQKTRSKRLTTQHVKWKYVISGKEGDRKEYGLPSEYYTYYGFHPDDSDENVGSSSRSTNPKSKTPSGGGEFFVTRGQQDIGEIRRQNKKRYDHIFETKPNTQLDKITKIIKGGMYTVDLEHKEETNDNAASDTGPTAEKPSQRRSSRLVVRQVMDDAKKVLETFEEDHARTSEYAADEDSEPD